MCARDRAGDCLCLCCMMCLSNVAVRLDVITMY